MAENWDIMIDFTKSIINEVTVGPQDTRISTVLFGNKAYIEFYLNTYETADEVSQAMDNLNYRPENTNTTGGLWVTRNDIFNSTNGDRDDIDNVILLVTDGIPTRDVEMLPDEVQKVRDAGIKIVAIGIGEANETFLATVAESEDYYYYLPDFISLSEMAQLVVQSICGVFPTEMPTTETPVTTPMLPGEK